MSSPRAARSNTTKYRPPYITHKEGTAMLQDPEKIIEQVKRITGESTVEDPTYRLIRTFAN